MSLYQHSVLSKTILFLYFCWPSAVLFSRTLPTYNSNLRPPTKTCDPTTPTRNSPTLPSPKPTIALLLSLAKPNSPTASKHSQRPSYGIPATDTHGKRADTATTVRLANFMFNMGGSTRCSKNNNDAIRVPYLSTLLRVARANSAAILDIVATTATPMLPLFRTGPPGSSRYCSAMSKINGKSAAATTTNTHSSIAHDSAEDQWKIRNEALRGRDDHEHSLFYRVRLRRSYSTLLPS
jgi:hypothetical protein